jgi:hypothetical protein
VELAEEFAGKHGCIGAQRRFCDMSDPRNVAHDKKVIHEKKHHGENPSAGAAETVQPGRKPEMQHHRAHEDPATERAEAVSVEVEAIQEAVEEHAEKTDIHKHP